MKGLHHEGYPSQSEMQEWLEANREIYSDFKGKVQSVLRNPLCDNHSELIDNEMATLLQVFIHRDEGHYSNSEDIATWKPNLHAHIVWDWMNHETGKSCKLDEKAMSEMQTVLAECLEMQRGISKNLTGKEHLERNDFIIAKQKQEAE